MSDSAVAARTMLDQVCINTVRTLAMDAVERANSGHPGTPMALAPLGYVLWTRHLRHSPDDPTWPGRDRFVLSCGHASMLLYSLLHLSGYDLSLDDLMAFRQWDSRTPGHPEYGMTPGVETTTGPLGQGFGNAVGMALAAAHLGAIFNRPGHRVVDQRVYVLLSDGDLMEGISHEVASLAGHLRLGNLVALFDDNGITIDGPASLACSDDVARRFEAYGWHVQRVADGNDLDAIDRALDAAKAEQGRPSLIIVQTHIGYGSPNKQDTAAAHGAPLGEEEVRLAKKRLGWPYDKPFTVPAEALAEWRQCVPRGQLLQAEWDAAMAAYADAEPAAAAELRRRLEGRLPDGWERTLPTFAASDGAMATRAASGRVLNSVAAVIPELLGGSADLAGSNNTIVKGAADLGPNHLGGRNMYFGIREHGMASVMNGMALHGGVIPYGGTFLVFSDYMRPAIRLAAMMGLRVVYVFTHDSIGLGEDGPTHQPVETLTALRAIPNLTVIRPGDAAETVQAWRVALRGHGPVALVLTRQKVPTLDRTILADAEGLVRGAYVLADPEDGPPEVILLASGSELALVVDAGRRLSSMGVRVRVVSAPSLELFRAQPEEYRHQVLPPATRVRLAVEAADMTPWYPWVGDGGDVLGMESFGRSAPYQRLFSEFGLTPEGVVDRVRRLIGT